MITFFVNLQQFGDYFHSIPFDLLKASVNLSYSLGSTSISPLKKTHESHIFMTMLSVILVFYFFESLNCPVELKAFTNVAKPAFEPTPT